MKWLLIVAGMLIELDAWAKDFPSKRAYPVKPAYPEELRRAGLTGEARLRLADNSAQVQIASWACLTPVQRSEF